MNHDDVFVAIECIRGRVKSKLSSVTVRDCSFISPDDGGVQRGATCAGTPVAELFSISGLFQHIGRSGTPGLASIGLESIGPVSRNQKATCVRLRVGADACAWTSSGADSIIAAPR